MKLRVFGIIILNIILLTTSRGVCQSYVEVPNRYMDFDVSTGLIDSLQKKGIANFIIYQTALEKDSIQSSNPHNSYFASFVTYIVWKEEKKTNVILITDSCVWQQRGEIANNVFSYSMLDKLWLREDENVYKVVPDYAEPYDKDIFMHITPKGKVFFELGRNAYYQLSEKRNVYRKEYIHLLNSAISHFDDKWEKRFDKKRWSN